MKNLSKLQGTAAAVLVTLGLTMGAAANAAQPLTDIARLDGSIGHVGARDPYTDGARGVNEPRSTFTDGARSVNEPRSPYSDGARTVTERRDVFAEGA
ncbi:hypothetical protein [Cupriavidus pampae]|uniref:Hydroxyquinol 1,2-dioxygenase n=1 Tax=Cupriavidus pampae TaxID=659251 RepID=A0ABM8XXU4_9BURK|nr:hypothetical protein [Cupriavidus pampae]CAG9185189.1 hypothetical protein LMG32289_05856 [Cupriavidus pampae]